ncbi:MAG: DUF2924 domain-containing protein, partial [Brevinema sp.]
MINALSQIRKEDINPNLSPSVCKNLLQWHTKAGSYPWRKLEALALGSELPQRLTLSFKAGTKLLRSYQGKNRLVLVTSDPKYPFLYEGQNFRSLSAIAQTITGTKWNGNLFFNVQRTYLKVAPQGNLFFKVGQHGK